MKLGISRTGWIILAVGITIIAFANLGVARFQQVQERNQLNEKLSLAKQKLSEFQLEQIYSQQEELEKQLDQTMSQFQTAKTILSQPIGSISTSGKLFDIAETCGIEVTEINSSSPASGNLEGIVCSILPFNVVVEGDVPNLIDFIIKLNGDFKTGVVTSVDMRVSENTGGEKSLANIRLLLYTHQVTGYE